MAQFADLYIYHAGEWMLESGRLDPAKRKDSKLSFKNVRAGDHALVYQDGVKTYSALLPALRFGADPVVFQYLRNKTWEPVLSSGGVDHNSAVMQGETAPISETLEGYWGDLLVGKETIRLGEAKSFEWSVVSASGKIQPVICEDKVLWLDDSPSQYLKASPLARDTLPAEFERSAIILHALNKEATRIKSAPESARGDMIMEIITNLSPGPVAGTTIPLDIALLLAEPFTVSPGDPTASLNVMTGSLQNAPPQPVATGLGSVGAANAYLQSFGSFVAMVVQAKAVHELRRDNASGGKKSAMAETAISSVKFANGMLQAVTKTITLAGPIPTAASQATAGVAGFAGVLLGAVASARSIRKAYNASERIDVLRKRLTTGAASEDLQKCAALAIQKLTRRVGKQSAMAGSATIGAIGGTLLTVTAIIGFSQAWNPVGWAVIGAGTLVAVGIGCYQLYRRYQRVNNRRKVGIEIGGVGGTSTAEQLVQKLVYVAIDECRSTNDRDFAKDVLTAFGVPEEQLNSLSMSSQSITPIIARFERHFHK